ncbi:MAG TPA: hydrogenase expression/formation protein HypE [Terriglobia bacterium]
MSQIFGACPAPILDHKTIVLGHGSGGKLTHQLIQKMILPLFSNPALEAQHDGAVLPIGGTRIAFSADSYVVNPLFFPGGNIGDLAVNGTVNDLSMCGARPQYLSASFIIEEGLAMEEFWRILCSMKDAADAAGVSLVTGDTKVIDRGKGDKIFINTSGVGTIPDGVTIDPALARPGDAIIVSGPIASHGMAIMSVREGLEFETPIESDTAALNGLVEAILKASSAIHVLRDPTRGGVASVLNEIAEISRQGILIHESSIPVRSEVQGACEILGLDPLYVANEGRLLAFVSSDEAERVLAAMRAQVCGRESAIIGQVVADHCGLVVMKTRVGGSRIVDMLSGEQLPRIC